MFMIWLRLFTHVTIWSWKTIRNLWHMRTLKLLLWNLHDNSHIPQYYVHIFNWWSFITLLLWLKIYKMPRNYVRKMVKSYTNETLAKCINAAKTGKMSLRKASKHFQVGLCYIFVVFWRLLRLNPGAGRVDLTSQLS